MTTKYQRECGSMTKEIKQLEIELSLKREPISETCELLLQYCEDQKFEDNLLPFNNLDNGFVNNENNCARCFSCSI